MRVKLRVDVCLRLSCSSLRHPLALKSCARREMWDGAASALGYVGSDDAEDVVVASALIPIACARV